MIRLLLLNNIHPVISYRRVQKKKKATNYCIRFGHSLWSAISCQRKRLRTKLDGLADQPNLNTVSTLGILKKKKSLLFGETLENYNYNIGKQKISNTCTYHI